MQKIVHIIFYSSVALIAASLLLIHLPSANPVAVFGAVFIASSVIYSLMAWTLFRVKISNAVLYSMLAAALAIRLTFISVSPIGSEDAYRYMWDGKVEAHGINPYLYSAVDPRLDALHSSLLPGAMNHADLKTIYFPLSEWVFHFCYYLSGESFWGYKAVLLLAEAGTFAVLLLFLPLLDIPRKFILLYALSPLPIIEFAVDSHIDAVGLPLLLVSLFLYFREKKIPSYVLLGLSISIKPVGLIILPALFFFENGWRNKVYALLLPLMTVGAQFLPYIFTSNPFETLFSFTKNWSFNGAVFELVYLYFQDNQTSRLVCAGMVAVFILILNVKRRDLLHTVYFSLLLLMLLSPVVHPWYVAWVVAVLPVMRKWSGIALAAGASLTSFTVMNYRLTGVWQQYPTAMVIEYLPVAVLLAVELRGYFFTRDNYSAV
ncbi:MAG TPA: hypothetical protein VMF88_10295 [Bacteroidota bacterium]|nr:hypothetical protein [Bacteroidota bacterium]